MRLVRSTIALLAATVLLAPHASARSAGRAHDAINFYILCMENSGLAYECQPSFIVREDDSTADIHIERGEHAEGETTFTFSATSGTATAGSDFVGVNETVRNVPDELHYVFQRPVRLLDDSEIEPVEQANLALSGPTGGVATAFPSQAFLTIADNDGDDRFSFEFDSYRIFENRKALRVVVVRSGADISAPASVTVTTQPGSATTPADFTTKEQTLSFGAGEFHKPFTVAIANDSGAEADESFTLNLSNPTGAADIERGTATITIDDEDVAVPDDTTAPYTAFHQPLQGETYSPEQAQALLVFAQDDDGGTGVERVQIAIRKNMSDGTCRWWTGSRFRAGPCTEKRWARTGPDTDTNVNPPSTSNVWFFEVEDRFARSVRGSGIKNYTAYSRGTDVAGNVQTTFMKGQNRNTYEIK